MQHAVRNRATIRVADRTDLSGTVTADKVNLDGFHSPIRKLRVIARTWLALVTVSLGLYLGLPVRGLAQNNQGQNDQGNNSGVPNGTYAFSINGQITPPGSTTLIPLASAGRVTYFRNGTDSGVVTVSFNGQILLITFQGTFTANGDGSFSETDKQTSFPFQTLHFTLYPTPNANTLTIIQTDPGNVASGWDTRGVNENQQ